jgi:AcrR family transcriptional regulator
LAHRKPTAGRIVRPWRQERSAATVQRIAAATMRLLVTKDFDSISVDEIVRLARTSKGSFYFRFATKAHLLRYLAEETFTALSAESRKFFQAQRERNSSLADFVEAFVERTIGVYASKRNLLRAFLQEARPGGDQVVVALVRAGSGEAAHLLIEGLLQRKDEIKHAAPDIAIPIGAIVLSLMLRQAILFPEQISLSGAIDQGRFRSELRRMVASYWNQAKHD